MNRSEQLYRGKAKTMYKTEDSSHLIMHFRDDITAFNAEKTAQLQRKGKVNNSFNAFIMDKLHQAGIKTHFVKTLSENESLVKVMDMIPVECVVRNIAAGSICKRLGLEEGIELEPQTFEFFYKSDELGDPMINQYHIRTFNWASETEVKQMIEQSFNVNKVLKQLFLDANMLLVDYKLEFGRNQGEILLGDEFTPDGCRIWDADTREKFDKDRFRRDLGNVVESYEIVAERLGIKID